MSKTSSNFKRKLGRLSDASPKKLAALSLQLSLFKETINNAPNNGHANTRLKSDSAMPVQELPAVPEREMHYVFSNIPRRDITEFNHGLHKYPAKFIPQLPRWAINYRRSPLRQIILDPFCGSGTTLVEAGKLGHQAIGCDVNPLAVLISKAKTADLSKQGTQPKKIIDEVIQKASKLAPELQSELVYGQECLGLHRTWSFWFRPFEMARLLAIREAIINLCKCSKPELSTFLLACLSSVAKASSFLNEDQIKVRYDKNKQLVDPFVSFPNFAIQALRTQLHLAQLFRDGKAQFSVELGSATKLHLRDASIDRVVTSPPYINAVDYTMAHKYNLFILGLIRPEDFKIHCREYIGITERAVRAADLLRMPEMGVEIIDEQVAQLWSLDTPVSRNRAFVVAQYFSGMYKAIKEMYRVVKPGGKTIIVVGYSNRICGQEIKTAPMLEYLAHSIGMQTELRFYHQLANRSSLRLNRSTTGGKVQFETVYVFNRP